MKGFLELIAAFIIGWLLCTNTGRFVLVTGYILHLLNE